MAATSDEYVPATQLRHTTLLVAPIAVEKVPEAQFMQAVVLDAPVKLEYVPARQLTHIKLEDAPGVVDQVPAMHAMHAVEPVLDQVPAAHAPQADMLVAPNAFEKAPEAQLRHTILDVAPILVEYVATWQPMHAWALVA